jgi:hypothetical protein
MKLRDSIAIGVTAFTATVLAILGQALLAGTAHFG